jgi:hypothetical protein
MGSDRLSRPQNGPEPGEAPAHSSLTLVSTTYGPVIVMNGPEKPANVSVYVKLESVIPPGIVGVQFGFGQVCCARNCCSVGAVAESEGTVSLPFSGESDPVLLVAVKVPWC